jgi:pimeloyl-ACP methyl ester carboxylesterase
MTTTSQVVLRLVACVAIAGLGAGHSAAAAVRPAKARATPTVALSLTGAPVRQILLCGLQHAVHVADERASVSARITLAVTRRGTRRVRLVVERCDNGRWRPAPSGPVTASRRGRPSRTGLDTSTAGDYRVYARVAGERGRPARSRLAYLRVGVGEIADMPVSFAITNVNRSKVPCLSDGREYRISGHLVAPRALLTASEPRAVTLYLHRIAAGEVTWRFSAVSGYDYAYEMARLGHASVTIDRLGFGASGIPDGNQVCVGSQADVAHQVVGALRGGDFSAGGGTPTSFQRVALAGHSYGGYIAAVEAYSFQDVDALVGVASAFDQGFGPAGSAIYLDFLDLTASCAGGGEPKSPGGPRGYFLFGKRFVADFFFNADPAVVEAARSLHERDPCGEFAGSFAQTLAVDQLYLPTVSVPVLLVFGDHDTAFPPSFAKPQSALYRASPDVTTAVIQDAGHELTLQRTAPALRTTVSDWLRARGF